MMTLRELFIALVFGPGEQPIDLPAISLKDAVLCLDCDMITPAKNGHCPACQGHSIMKLSNVIGEIPHVGRVARHDISSILEKMGLN